MSELNPEARRDSLLVQELGDELLLYEAKTARAHCLNPTAAQVWRLADGKTSVEELAAQAGVEPEVVWVALEDLHRESLLLNGEKLFEQSTVSRRDLLQKAGLLAAAAVPLVMSVTAASPAQAASGVCANSSLDSCSSDADCASSSTGDTCFNNCCVFGPPIPGGGLTGGGSVIP